jgi:hypothetical protein
VRRSLVIVEASSEQRQGPSISESKKKKWCNRSAFRLAWNISAPRKELYS